MSIISKSRLFSLTESKIQNRSFSEVLNEAKKEGRTYASTSVFLSHSHEELDRDYVKRTITLLRSLGMDIYIDSDDLSMPPFTNATTAVKIKAEIKNNKKFILLATNNALQSRWCNWELGYGDSYKYINNIALFPLSENDGSWKGQEYLQIYSRIEESALFLGSYNVIFPDGKYQKLQEWLLA